MNRTSFALLLLFVLLLVSELFILQAEAGRKRARRRRGSSPARRQTHRQQAIMRARRRLQDKKAHHHVPQTPSKHKKAPQLLMPPPTSPAPFGKFGNSFFGIKGDLDAGMFKQGITEAAVKIFINSMGIEISCVECIKHMLEEAHKLNEIEENLKRPTMPTL